MAASIKKVENHIVYIDALLGVHTQVNAKHIKQEKKHKLVIVHYFFVVELNSNLEKKNPTEIIFHFKN